MGLQIGIFADLLRNVHEIERRRGQPLIPKKFLRLLLSLQALLLFGELSRKGWIRLAWSL